MAEKKPTSLRTPPFDKEAEQSLIGAMLMRPAIVADTAVQVKQEDFYTDRYRRLFAAMIEMDNQGKVIDFVTVSHRLKLDANEKAELVTLSQICPATSNWRAYAEIVRTQADMRRVASIGRQLAEGDISASDAQEKLTEINSAFRTSLSTENCTETNILRTWAEVVTDSAEGREWLVDGLIPMVGLGLLGGWAKHGKSTLAIHLCRDMAQGKPFLSRTTLKAPTIYVNYEMPGDYRAELMAAGGIPESAYWVDRPEPTLTKQGVRKLISLCTEVSPIAVRKQKAGGLLVVDSFRGAFRVEDENSTVAGVILRELQDLAVETGWFILVVHHFNKSKNDFSGTGDFYAAPDVLLKWKREDAKEPGILKVEGRLAPIEPMAISMNLSEVMFLGEAGRVGREREEARILESLTTEPVLASVVGEALDIPDGSARSYLSKLHERGEVSRQGEGKRGSPFLYYRSPQDTLEDT